MKNAIILHGMSDSKKSYLDTSSPDSSSPSNGHWLPWLQLNLLANNILAQTPELPHPYLPVYSAWLKVFKESKIDEETILVGHSCGAGFLVRFLSENNIKVDKLVLVAPWLDPEKEIGDFADFKINLKDKAQKIIIFYSEDDSNQVLKSVELLKREVQNIEFHIFKDKGHFTFGEMHTIKFPELLEAILN